MNQIIYVFNLKGKLIDTIKSIRETSKKYKYKTNTINSYIKNKVCVDKKYYFSLCESFIISKNKINDSEETFDIDCNLEQIDDFFRSYESSLDFC